MRLMETKIIKLEENLKTSNSRIENAEKKIEKLEDTYKIIEKMDYRIYTFEEKLSEIHKTIENIDSDKGKKWDKLIDYIFYAILAYCLYKLGIG